MSPLTCQKVMKLLLSVTHKPFQELKITQLSNYAESAEKPIYCAFVRRLQWITDTFLKHDSKNSMSSIIHDDGPGCLRDSNSGLLTAHGRQNCSSTACKSETIPYKFRCTSMMVPLFSFVRGLHYH